MRVLVLALLWFPLALTAQQQPRARDLGVPFPGTPGRLDAITDVPGVEVGHSTIIRGSGKLVVGEGPIRTGVTAIFPRGRGSTEPAFAAWFTLNGNGEMTGTTWVEESGYLLSPVLITNTHSVGTVHQAAIEYLVKRGLDGDWSLPVVAETWDGSLNDINGFHVKKEHVFAALDSARSGPVAEGNVGGGTGMICHQFKGGIGTASRRVSLAGSDYAVGVLVQCNYGLRPQLRIAGVPVGEEIPAPLPCVRDASLAGRRQVCGAPRPGDAGDDREMGSIIIVVATDVPLLPHQLKRVARRASLGVGKMGGIGGNSSGDIFIAFSTGNPGAERRGALTSVRAIANDDINAVFDATVQAAEEAIINALVAARTMTGADSLEVPALPHERLREVLRKYGRLK